MQRRIGRRRARTVAGAGIRELAPYRRTSLRFGDGGRRDNNISCPDGSTQYKADTNVLQGLSTGQSKSFTINGKTFTVTKILGTHPFEDDSFDWIGERLRERGAREGRRPHQHLSRTARLRPAAPTCTRR